MKTTNLAPSNYSSEQIKALCNAKITLGGITTSCTIERQAIKSAIEAIDSIVKPTAEMRRCASNRALAYALESNVLATLSVGVVTKDELGLFKK